MAGALGFLGRWVSKALNGLRLWGLPGHRKAVRSSRSALRTLRSIASEGAGPKGPWEARVLGYLRAVDSQVFEELLLSRFEEDGWLVARNRRYSGDGGVDGRVRIPGLGWVPVQAKRYAGAVKPSHARDFARLVGRRSRAGIFAHCGRTTEGSFAGFGREVLLLSGFDLARWACGIDSSGVWLAAARSRAAKRSG